MSNQLQVIEQRTVTFYDDQIPAVLVEQAGETAVYIPIRPICDFLGVAWSPQRRRVNRDPVLSTVTKGVTVTVTPGGRQEMICLPLDYISGFLFGISALRVKEEIKERLILYQRECYRVLNEAFQDGRLTTDSDLDELLKQDTPEAQAYLMAQAVMRLARSQLLMKSQVDSNTERIENIEIRLGSSRTITPDQATAVSQAVKAIALELGKASKRNEFGAVYGEFYRRFRIPSYKQLPAAKYDEAMSFLGEWLESLTGEEPF